MNGGAAPRGFGFPVHLARLAMRHPRAVIAFFAVTGAVATVSALRVREAEDLLDFIPQDDSDVRSFKEVGKTFGALRVAYIGLHAPDGDVLSAAALRTVDAVTRAVRGVRGVDSVDSLTTIEDVSLGEGGMPDTRQLVEVDHLPATPEEERALRAKVLSRENIVGNFVSRSGDAALVLAYLADGASDRLVSRAARDAVEQALRGSALRPVYGGAPFVASAIYEETQADVRRLTPVAVLILLCVVLFAFRDPLGVVLTIVSVAWSAVMVIGIMALLGEPFTAASATLPVILFASGTSYSVHVLGRYYLLDPPPGVGAAAANGARLLEALRIVGPPVTIASLTTAEGFLAFLVMDIRPMRAFGVECAAGVLLAMLSAFLLVPAVVVLFPRTRRQPAATGPIGELLAALSASAARRRVLVIGAAALLGVVGLYGMSRLQVRMEPRQFFRPGSQPWAAERFLAQHFGGSQILQVSLRGDVTAPAVLYEMKRLEQFARSLPDVTQATSVVAPLLQLADVMNGERRLPETREQVPQLLFFVEGKAFLKRLLSPARDQALVLIRTQGDSAKLVLSIEDYLWNRFNARPSGPGRAEVAERIHFIARAAGEDLADEVVARMLDSATPVALDDTRMVEARRVIATALLTGAEEILPPRRPSDGIRVPGSPVRTVADLIETLASDKRPPASSPHRADVVAIAASPEEGALAWSAWTDRVARRARELAVDEAMRPAGPMARAAIPAVRDAIADLFPTRPIERASRPLEWALAGEPILDRGMSRSVRLNHEKSMAVALVLVALTIFLLFGVVRLALIGIAPAALTLVGLFGGIGLQGVPIDLGTSLVTSIATGAGSEFAVQYLWYLKHSSPRDVVRFVGPIMVISTLLIAAGFAVLALGHSQPMRMFGALAALSMAGSAALTFLLVPALLPKSHAAPPA